MVAALREAGRVAKPGAPVVIQVWGQPERCDLDAMKHAVAPFLPPPDPNAPRGSALWKDGVLERIATEAGLTPGTVFASSWAYEYPDEQALARAMLSAGGIAELVGPSREAEARTAIVEALAARRTAGGGYRLENEWRYLVTAA